MIPGGQKSDSRTSFGDKEPPKSVFLKKQQPLGCVAETSACLDHCPVTPLSCGKQCGRPSWFVGDGRKPVASSVLFLILDPFNVCSHHDRIPSPIPEWQDLLLSSSLWARRIFAEVSTLKCFPVPTQPLETLRILPRRGSLPL